MKRVLAMLCVLASLSVSRVAANEPYGVSERLKRVFAEQFPDAENVNFQLNKESVIVTFTSNFRICLAAYDQDAEFIGSGHYLTKDEIPSKVIHALEKKLGKFELQEALEFSTSDDRLSYFCVNVVTDKERVLARVFNRKKVEVVKRHDKL